MCKHFCCFVSLTRCTYFNKPIRCHFSVAHAGIWTPVEIQLISHQKTCFIVTAFLMLFCLMRCTYTQMRWLFNTTAQCHLYGSSWWESNSSRNPANMSSENLCTNQSHLKNLATHFLALKGYQKISGPLEAHEGRPKVLLSGTLTTVWTPHIMCGYIWYVPELSSGIMLPPMHIYWFLFPPWAVQKMEHSRWNVHIVLSVKVWFRTD